MSEKTKKTVCPECGTEVDVNEKKDFKKILDAIRGVLEDEKTDDAELPAEEATAEEATAGEATEGESTAEGAEESPASTATVTAAKPSLRGRFKLIFGKVLTISSLCF